MAALIVGSGGVACTDADREHSSDQSASSTSTTSVAAAHTANTPDTESDDTPATTAPTPPSSEVDWENLPPIDTPPDLVPDSYDGRLLAYGAVVDVGDGATLCPGGVHDLLPLECEGVPIEGWDWTNVEHEEESGARWGGEYALIGQWTGTTFVLTEPAFDIDWSQINEPAPEKPIDVPCPEPEGGWWSDTTDPQLLGPDDYNAAISVVNTRPSLVAIDVVPPDEPRPAHIRVEPDELWWQPGVLVVRLADIREGDEEAIRAHWGGPVCLAEVQELSVGALGELETEVAAFAEDLAPDIGVLWVGWDDAEIQVGVLVATVETQARFDNQFGADIVTLVGRFWAIDHPS